jgi:tellurite resistance protein
VEYSVDYLSFTVPFDTLKPELSHLLGGLAEQAVSDFLGVYIHAILDNQPFTVLRGRAPYAASWGRADGGVRIFGAPQISHVLVEITGAGCKTLREHGQLEEILSLVSGRVSRIDMAVDIETATPVAEFASLRAIERFKSISDIRSETGDTYYVGSWKSDRFARVYRFAPPHPRSDKLRVEHVYRRDAAKAFAKVLLAGGYPAAVAGAGMVYGWSHPSWDTGDVQPIEATAGQLRKSSKNTVNWLYDTVTSSIIKQVKKGELNLDEFINHIRKELDSATK